MSKVSIKNFKMAALTQYKETREFVHALAELVKARSLKESVELGLTNFQIAEMMNPQEESVAIYRNCVRKAVDALFVLNKAFYAEHRMYIVGQIESFDEAVDVLEFIEDELFSDSNK